MRTPSIDVLRSEHDIHPASSAGRIFLSVLLALSMLGGGPSGAFAMDHSLKQAVVQEATEIDCNISSLANELTTLRKEAHDIAAVQMGYLGVDAADRKNLSTYFERENSQGNATPSGQEQVAADIAGETVADAKALHALTETWIALIDEVNSGKRGEVELAISEYGALRDHIKSVGQKAANLQHAERRKRRIGKPQGCISSRVFTATHRIVNARRSEVSTVSGL